MIVRHLVRISLLSALAVVVSASTAAAQGGGLKVGPTFADFSSENLDFNTRTGIQAGLFVGGSRDSVITVQTEFNWIRKNAELDAQSREIRIDYFQVPVLLRLNAGTDSSAFTLYGIAGPAIDLKVADEIEGITLDDGFEGADVSLIFGGGVEISRFILEGRYSKGLRRINKEFNDLSEIKTQSFAILFGVRFN